jgi:hypothetical protein
LSKGLNEVSEVEKQVKEGRAEFRRKEGGDRKLAWGGKIMSRKKSSEDEIGGTCRMHG